MNEQKIVTYADFALPPSVVSKIDVSRLVREFERIDNELTSASVRAKVSASEQVGLTVSDQLTDFLQLNGLKIDQDGRKRSEFAKQLALLKDKVPVIHMTFAVTADRESLQQLAQWLRTSIHPQAVISVGLQPALVAGVYVRTPNHVHDLSLRAKLRSSHGILVKELEAVRGRR